MYSFKQLIGHTIGVLLVNQSKMLDITILGVENGGIWVESSDANEAVCREATLETFGLKPIIFFPYAQIRYAWFSLASPDSKEHVV